MGKAESKDQRCVKDDDDFVMVQTYKGETKNGKRHGRGLYVYTNGDMYDGEWRKSRKYGKGVYMYANGQRYVRRTSSLDNVILLNYICILA